MAGGRHNFGCWDDDPGLAIRGMGHQTYLEPAKAIQFSDVWDTVRWQNDVDSM